MENVEWLFILLCIGVVVYWVKLNNAKEQHLKKQLNIINDNFNDNFNDEVGNYFCATIYSGFREYGVIKDVSININKNNIRFFIEEDEKNINLNDIEDYRIQTETQLIERASLLKTAAFGIFSLGMKGKVDEVSKEYIYIKCQYENEETYIILDTGNFNTNFIKKIREYKKLLI